MIGLLRYLFRQTERDLLPKLKNHLTTQFDRSEEIDWETELVLMRGLVRDPRQVRALMEQYEVSTAEALLEVLPEPPGPDWRGRFWRWVQHVEGSYARDPHVEEDRETLQQYRTWWQ